MASTRRPPAGRSRPSRADAERSPDRAAARARRPRAGRRRRRSSELLQRVVIAVPLAILALVFIHLGGLPWALLMVVLGWVCMSELYAMLRRWRPVAIVGFAALIGMVMAARYGHVAQVMEVAVGTLPVLFLAVLARGHGHMTVAMAGTLLGVYWLGFAFAHAVLLRQLPHGNGILLDVLLGTFLGDTGAYLGGRLVGRRPLAPSISPHKTVEGLICGMLVTVVAVFLAGQYQTWLTSGDALLLGAVVAVIGPLGDLFESVIKREAGTKDAGHMFGAHGGALDRLDAAIFTVVAGYYIWLAVMP